MRSCTPIFVGTAPRESVFKSAPHSAAPVGKPSQTRRHHLTPTPVQRGGTKVPERDQKRFFLLDRPRPVLFLSRTKREWGVDCPASNLAHAPVPSDGISRTSVRPSR